MDVDASRNVNLEPLHLVEDETSDKFVACPPGAASSSTKADAATKKARRTTVYPNVNSTNKVEKPFSRSAAKRGSVMALGSIEHLQHYFTKAGLSASKVPKGAKGPFVPALGPGVTSLVAPSGVPTLVFDLPPSPLPQPPPSPGLSSVPVVPSPYIADPETLKLGVVNDLEAVENAWHLNVNPRARSIYQDDLDSPLDTAQNRGFDVLHVLKITTRAIRSVRNYLLALPDDHPTLHFGANLIEAFQHHSLSKRGLNSRRLVSGSSTPRPSVATSSLISSPSSIAVGALLPAPPDPSSIIRRAALDVLSALRVLEERSRLPLSDDAYEPGLRAESPISFALDREPSGSIVSADEGSDVAGSVTLVAGSYLQPPRSPKPDIIPLKVQGRDKAVPVWADLEDDQWEDFDDDPAEKQDPWDERLVLGGGWLYRRDVDLVSIEKERSVVKRYLDLADEVVFANSIPATPGQRGWKRARLESGAKSRPGMSPRSSLLAPPEDSPRKNGESNLARKRLISTTLLDAMSEISMLTTDSDSIETPARNDVHGDQPNDNDIPDDSLPDWARRYSYPSNPIGRLYSFIAAHLPHELLSFIPDAPHSPSDPFISSPEPTAGTKDAFRQRLLTSLSDGQILCTAYNRVVRRSRSPWGYIHLENVHDLLCIMEEPEKEQPELDLSLGSSQRANAKAKSSWTFRRTENLRYWAAALKHRYTIPFIMAPADGTKRLSERKSTTSLSRAFSDPLTSPPVYFEPKMVAARESGWEDMFQRVLERWLEAVLNETRTRA